MMFRLLLYKSSGFQTTIFSLNQIEKAKFQNWFEKPNDIVLLNSTKNKISNLV